MPIPTQGVDTTQLDDAHRRALAILTQMTPVHLAQLKNVMHLGVPAVVGPQTLEAFVTLCGDRGLDLSAEGLTTFKAAHHLDDTGANEGAIGHTTAEAYAAAILAATPAPAAPGRHVTARGMHVVQNFEGLERVLPNGLVTAYLDQVGVPTIGWGHTAGVHMGMTVTRADCEAFLAADLHVAEEAVTRLVKVSLSDNQFDALVSFTFNVGTGALAASTLLRDLNAGDYAAAADQFLRWVNGDRGPIQGLVARRQEERALFLRAG
jgi:GH24 family phage-related lysozyme (muramidase)